LVRIEFPAKAALDLSLVVTIQAKDCKVSPIVVCRIVIYVMNLSHLSANTAYTAGSVVIE